MNALVLSGGGGKGAYQIGVWKALKKLNYKIDIVTGTSVGALNATLITQDSHFLASYIWSKLDYKEIFHEDVKRKKDLKEVVRLYGKNIIENQGMDTSKLENKIHRLINYDKFYNSNIDFGLVTYNLSNMKPIFLTKKQIPKDKLKDYLIASSTAFPAFKLKNIDGNNYIDGGYFDILPINLAIDMGATNIIAVDLKSIGIRQKTKNTSANITYIKPKNYIGYILVFDKDINKRNMQYGYNDTLKTFKVLEGDKFTFKKGTISAVKERYLENIKNNLLYFLSIKSSTKSNKILSNKIFNDLINKDLSKYDGILKILEELGKYFGIAPYNIYSLSRFNFSLNIELNKTESIKRLTISNSKKEIIKYLYKLMVKNNTKLLKKIALSLPNEFICAIYLYTVIKGRYYEI